MRIGPTNPTFNFAVFMVFCSSFWIVMSEFGVKKFQAVLGPFTVNFPKIRIYGFPDILSLK